MEKEDNWNTKMITQVIIYNKLFTINANQLVLFLEYRDCSMNGNFLLVSFFFNQLISVFEMNPIASF